jgi:hypothetical protein
MNNKIILEHQEWDLMRCGECDARIGYNINNATIEERLCIACYLEKQGIKLDRTSAIT